MHENQMFWLASNDTGGEDNFKSRVSVFLGGVESQELTWVPYNRIVLSDEESASKIRIGLTDMTIGKSIRTYLSGQSITSYPTLTISTTDYHSRNQSTFLSAMTTSSSTVFRDSSRPGSRRRRGPSYGFLLLTLTLGSFSLTELSDDNPINMLDFVANIGGFWEVLLLAWGVFFVATHETAPKQKARKFTISTKTGKHPAGVKEPRSPAAVASDRTCGVDDQLDSSQVTDTSDAGHQVGVATPLDTWPSAGNRYGGGGSSIDNENDVSQVSDTTYGGELGVVDNRLDISQPSHTSFNDDDASVNGSYV